MDKVQKIRKEVERLQNELIQEREKGYGSDVGDACILELQNVLTYIDSLQEEPLSEDLEEEAKHYLYSNILYDDVYVGNPTDKDCIEMFKAGAKWQKARNQETIETAIHHAYHNGRLKMKEQMMKEAIDGYVIEDIEEGNGDFLLSCEYLPKNMGLVDQQKVKVIVIKED